MMRPVAAALVAVVAMTMMMVAGDIITKINKYGKLVKYKFCCN